MEYHLSIDKKEMYWAVEQSLRKYKQLPDDMPIPRWVIGALFNVYSKSPALTLPSENVIFLKTSIPPEYVPVAIAHEELHILVYRICTEEKLSLAQAQKASKGLVDNSYTNEWLVETFGIKYKDFMNWLTDWVVTRTLPLRIKRAVLRLLGNDPYKV